MHTIRTDARTGIVDIAIAGFCSDDELARFMTDLDAAVAAVAAAGRRHSIIVDYTHAAIQSQQTIAALQARVLGAERKARRVALFTRGHLARMQAKRIASVRDTVRVFDDRDTALAWLRAADDTRPSDVAQAASAARLSRTPARQ